MESEIQQLKKDIAELEAFKAFIERQQLTFPLDKVSQDIVHKDLMVPTGKVTYPADILSYGSDAIEGIAYGKRYFIKAK